MGCQLGLFCGILGEANFVHYVGNRFVGDCVFAAFHGGDCYCCVEVVGGHYVAGVEVFLLLEHLAEVAVGIALIRA